MIFLLAVHINNHINMMMVVQQMPVQFYVTFQTNVMSKKAL